MGGAYEVGGGGTDGSLYADCGGGRKLDLSDPATGTKGERGGAWGVAAVVGLKVETPGPTAGFVDEKGVTAGGEDVKGEVGLLVKAERPGFSVPMELI